MMKCVTGNQLLFSGYKLIEASLQQLCVFVCSLLFDSYFALVIVAVFCLCRGLNTQQTQTLTFLR